MEDERIKEEVTEKINERLRRRKRRNRLVRRVKALSATGILLIIAASIGVLIYVNRDKINRDTVKKVTTVGSAEYTKIGGAADLGHDAEVRITPFASGIAAVTTSELRYSTAGGEENFFIETDLSAPSVTASGGYCAAYDMGGKLMITADKNGKLASADASGGITSASVNSSGFLAVVTDEAGYRSCVSVYDKKLRLLYKWQTPDYYVTAAAVSDDGKTLAAAVVYVSGGGVRSAVKLFAVGQSGVLAQTDEYDGICVLLTPTGKGFTVLRSDGVSAFGNGGESRGEYSFEAAPLEAFSSDGKGGFILLLKPGTVSERYRIVRLDGDARQLGTVSTGDDVGAVAACGDDAAVYRAGSVYLYGEGFRLEKILTPTKLEVCGLLLIKGGKLLVRTHTELLAY